MKAGSDFDLTRYAPVAERITQFYCAILPAASSRS